MSGLHRTRSLRKPTQEILPDASVDESSRDHGRNASPSRLPVKFHTRSRSTVTAPSSATAVSRQRPTSTLLDRAASTRLAAGASQEPGKREASRYPPSTTVTRTQPASNGRPTSSGNAAPAPAKRTVAHTRAKSTTANSSTTGVLRSPSREQASTTRTATTHRANPSVDRTTTSSSAQTPVKGAPHAQPRLRPAFSTLQKHYSPAKTLAPKPTTSSYLAPPSPSKLPANVAASAETNRLQAELLQLQLLHKDAAVVDEAWRQSAKDKLRRRFEDLVRNGRDVSELEKAQAGSENVLALRAWGAAISGAGGLEQKIQALDVIVNGVWTLSEPAGRHARAVRRFERWIDRVCEIEDARGAGTALTQSEDHLFISELDSAWKEEAPGLVRKLDGWRRQLKELGDVPEAGEADAAGLARMVHGCRALIDTMLRELLVMDEIEQEALRREEEWIAMVNREDDNDDTPVAGAVWRTF